MMTRENMVQENRVRRTAKQRGFVLKRSRRRDRQALDYGKYWLLDLHNRVVFPTGGAASWGGTLDDAEGWLNIYGRE